MSVRRVDFARLESAGWTVTVDSPWRRLGAVLVRLVRWHATTAAGAGWSR